MKRQVLLSSLLLGFCTFLAPASPQDNPAAAGQGIDPEDFKRMTSYVEDLQKTVQSCQLRLAEQREEIRKLSEELARVGSNKDALTREDFKHLADKIREVDERRVAGDKEIVEKFSAELARLGKTITAPPRVTPPTPAPVTNTTLPEPKQPVSDKGWEYTVRQNDNPHVIAQALAKKGVKVTAQQIMDANPSVVWTKLKIGQKLFIPAPAQQ